MNSATLWTIFVLLAALVLAALWLWSVQARSRIQAQAQEYEAEIERQRKSRRNEVFRKGFGKNYFRDKTIRRCAEKDIDKIIADCAREQ